MKKKLFSNILVVVIFVFVFSLFQRILMPKYMTEIFEGNLVEEYYDSDKDHDVIFLGDCEVFSNVSPVSLWDQHGITSYIRGSAQQLIWQSYYLLEETLTYETPDVVVFNVLAMKYDQPQNEAYNRMTIDGMKWSKSKIGAINSSMTEEESFVEYVLPILRYHSRWNELGEEDFKYMFNKKPLSHNGYLMRADIKPVTMIPEGRILPDYEFGENSYYYLDKITKICKDNDVELILIKSPSVYPYWYEEWDEQMVDYADKNDLTYINFLEVADEMGIDYETDTFDAGLHLNLSGAEKFTSYFGEILSKDFALENRKDDTKLASAWNEKVEHYEWMKEDQLNEIKNYGNLISYGAPAQAQ